MAEHTHSNMLRVLGPGQTHRQLAKGILTKLAKDSGKGWTLEDATDDAEASLLCAESAY